MAEVRVPVIKPHGHSLEKDVDYKAGVISGLVGSAISALAVMFTTIGTDQDFFLLPKLTAVLALPVDVAEGALGIIIGIVSLLILGVIFGLVFAGIHTLLTTSYSLISSIVLGLIYGFGLWFATFLILGPIAGSEMAERIGPEIALPSFLILGLILGFYPGFMMPKES